MAQFMRSGSKPPRNYRGRYTDETDLEGYLQEKEQERAGHQPVDFESLAEFGQKQHIPSLNEQEAMLRELSRQRKGSGKDGDDSD